MQHGAVATLGGSVRRWDEDAAAPLAVVRTQVEPVFMQLESRAILAGHETCLPVLELTEDANLHVVTDQGHVIRKSRMVDGHAIFMLPPGVARVHLVSRAARPCDTIGPFVDDRRELGVLIGRFSVFENNVTHYIDTHLVDDSLHGWDVVEASACRWTQGDAVLPVSRMAGGAAIALLAVEVLAGGPYLAVEQERSIRRA